MLTDTVIRNIKPLDKPKKYTDSAGLYLYVPISGNKFWRMDYSFDGKRKVLSLGEYPAISLKMARAMREDAKRLIATGVDPAVHKKQEKAAIMLEQSNTFEHIAREWHETQTIDCTEANRIRKLKTLERYAFPVLGSKAIEKIEVADILAIIKPIEAQNKIDKAHRVKEYINMVMRYAVAIGKVKHNITNDIHRAIRPRKPVHRASIIDTAKIGELLLDIENFTGYFQTKSALQLMPMFFVRTDELRLAEWREFDLEEGLWRIPAERMKMRLPHIVPLATQAVAILTGLREYTGQSRFVFPSVKTFDKTLGKATLLHAIRGMGYRKDVMSIHGFRSIASTLLNELGYNRDWIERQLAHREKNSARDAYNFAQYLQQRQKMMQEWADYLMALLAKARKNAGKPKPNTEPIVQIIA